MMERYKFFSEAANQKEIEAILPILEQLYSAIKTQYNKELKK
jgi:hypothetical protein